MSKVFNMVGGGGKNISSIIITGLKSTDTITCTKDGKSYIATWDETAQHWEIVGLPLGTFTLTATRDSMTTTQSVLIDIAGLYEIEMAFKLWLYRDGVEFEDITGGWGTSGYSHPTRTLSAATKNSDNFAAGFIKGAGIVYMLGTINPIDLTNYNKASIEIMKTDSSNLYQPHFELTSSKASWGQGSQTAFSNPSSANVREIIELDISGISGNYYPVFGYTNETGDGSGYLYKVWLE